MDVDAAVLHHHALKHGADELLPSVEVERGERTEDTVDKGLQIRLELRLLLGARRISRFATPSAWRRPALNRRWGASATRMTMPSPSR